MSAGFVKLYGSIIHSSIWNEPDNVRLVWVTMLAMSTYHGIVEASVGGIAHAARVSKEACEDALRRLQSPDPDSRDGTTGERIRRIEGGWEIINHGRYRDMRTHRQVKQAEYQRRYESKLKGAQAEQTEKPEHQMMLSPSLSLSSSPSESPSDSEGRERERGKLPPKPDDVPDDLWREWVAFRRGKRATVTQRVLNSTRKTAKEAGMSMAEAFTYWIANGQTGFFPPKNAKGGRQGGFDRWGKWQGVPGDTKPEDYSQPITEDNDPFCEHPANLMKRENAQRASKGLPPLSGMDELKILYPEAF